MTSAASCEPHDATRRKNPLAVDSWTVTHQHTQKGSGGGAQHTYFTYDASGQRVRKVAVSSGVIKERIYLGGYEVYRERAAAPGAPIDFERQTLHLMDDQRRVAMTETKTREGGAPVASPTTRWRFQLDNHLGSATLELDAAGNVISYEEYHPYGSTAFHTADGAAEVSAKRYRYTGKEKDEETGLYYHGARYYAPWLGRWTAADPLGIGQPGRPDLNLYVYARGEPVVVSDPSGMQDTRSEEPANLEKTEAASGPRVRQGITVVYSGEDMEQRLVGGQAVLVPRAGAVPRRRFVARSETDPVEAWLSKLAALEGSVADWRANPANRSDRGGLTNYGITLSTYQKLRPKATKAEFEGLTPSDIEQIARGLFRAYGADKITDPGLAILLAESYWAGFSADALNRALQAVGRKPVAKQRSLDPATLAEINAADPNALADAYLQERLEYHRRLGQSDASQQKFVAGWDRRFRSRWIEAKVLSGNAADAARWLNGQSLAVLNSQLALLSKEDIAELHAAAVTAPGVGSESRFARLTKSVYDSFTTR